MTFSHQSLPLLESGPCQAHGPHFSVARADVRDVAIEALVKVRPNAE